MKLADWARKQGIAYLTAYRWFKDGKLPVKAYQSDSGTIIVEDDDDKSEQKMQNNLGTQNDIFGLVLKKVVEFSKNNSTLEDFAAYILSNFSLKLNSGTDTPRYSKNKPKPEDIQKHFQQFIPKGERPKPNMFVTNETDLDSLVEQDENLTAQEAKINAVNAAKTVVAVSKTFSSDNLLYNEISSALNASNEMGSTGSVGMGYSTQITPQNYTVSTGSTVRRLSDPISFDSRGLSLSEDISDCDCSETQSKSIVLPANGPTGAFKPTQKEMEQAQQTFNNAPRRRGRKPSKNIGKK
jgi:hypothetical protein